MEEINFDDQQSHLLLNPRAEQSFDPFDRMPGHIYLGSSGSTGTPKLVALSKRALLVSAVAVNNYFSIKSIDCWLNVLPIFHVAGLSIFARSFLSGCQVLQQKKWDVKECIELLEKATVVSFVPTQLYDLLLAGFTPHKKLRHIIIGGGVIDPEIYEKVKSWPLVSTYGMTECSSMIAVEGNVLPHIELKMNNGRIELKSEALLTGYQLQEKLIDPREEGWFCTQDLGEIVDDKLTILGREDSMIKICGELVNTFKLQDTLSSIASDGYRLQFEKDLRLGQKVVLYASGPADEIVDAFNSQVMPYERIREVRTIS